MENIGIAGFLLIAANCFVSYKGMKDHSYFDRYSFEVGEILEHKDYKRLITSGFLHVSWMHLIFNMLSLYLFSGLVEDAMGQEKFLLIYFASLLGGNLFSLFIHRHHPDYSAVGASGAISGIIFSTIALFPGMRLSLLILPVFVPSWLFGLLFVLYSIYGVRSKKDNIGHEAHLGGALVGMCITIAMNPRMLIINYLPIALISIPSIIFIYAIIKRPEYLMVDNHYYKSHTYTLEDKYNINKRNEEKEIDRILEKIHAKGMSSLTEKEKETLHRRRT